MPPAPPKVHVAADSDAVADVTARRFAEIVKEAIAARGTAIVALAGGQTPRAAYARLAAPPLRDSLDWSRVVFFFGDERGVPPDHHESNYRMARETLFASLRIEPSRIHRMEAERPDADEAAREYASALRRACGVPGSDVPRLDLAHLGLGSDGHTASLFPDSPALGETHRLVVPAPGPGVTRRLTMSLPLLAAARAIVFTATSAAKGDALRRVLGRTEPLPPAARVESVHGSLEWIVDSELAAAAGVAPG